MPDNTATNELPRHMRYRRDIIGRGGMGLFTEHYYKGVAYRLNGKGGIRLAAAKITKRVTNGPEPSFEVWVYTEEAKERVLENAAKQDFCTSYDVEDVTMAAPPPGVKLFSHADVALYEARERADAAGADLAEMAYAMAMGGLM